MLRSLLALLAACPFAALAADVLPAHLAGTWSTEPSMDLYTPGNQVMLLRADGYGLVFASRPGDDGKPGSRDVMGYPMRITLEGDTLTLKPVHPSRDPAILEKQTVICRYKAASTTLDCSGWSGAGGAVQRRSETVSEKMSMVIDKLRRAEEARP